MSAATSQDQALRPPQAAEKLGIALSTLWLKAKNEPDFPKPFKLGPRITVWSRQSLDDYLTAAAAKVHAAQAT